MNLAPFEKMDEADDLLVIERGEVLTCFALMLWRGPEIVDEEFCFEVIASIGNGKTVPQVRRKCPAPACAGKTGHFVEDCA